MKKILLILTLGLFFTRLNAQENSLLWEISKEGYYTSYLYGTIHLNDERVFQFGDSVLSKLYQCDAYAGEIIIQPEDMLKIMPYIFEKDSKKQCKKVFSEKEYKKIAKVVSAKLGEEMLVILPFMSPYVVSIILSYPSEDAENEKSAYYLDMYLQEQADSLEKKLISLETIESQFAYINKIEIEKQKEHLLKIIKDKQLDGDVEDLVQVYVDEDLEKMMEILHKYEGQDPLMTEEFMVGRNYIHKDGMVDAMKQQSTFTAVGAAHLIGEKGIVTLLRADGFSVQPIFK